MYQKKAQINQKKCDEGDLYECQRLADLYIDGRGVEKDFKKAADLYQKACDGGKAAACLILGDLYKAGKLPKSRKPISKRAKFA